MDRERGTYNQAFALCIPFYCAYAHACPVKASRQRYVARRDCFRYQPQWQRPAPGLSDFARQTLAELREDAQASPQGSPAN